MYNSSGSTLSLNQKQIHKNKIVPAKKDKEKKEKKKSIFRSWNAPVFCKVVEWLQHWGKKPERWPMEPAFTVFKVPFWNIRKRMKGKRISHFWGKGRLFLLMFGYESETAKHLFVSKNLRFSSTKFSFQSSDRCFKMRKGVCYVVLCVTGIHILT